MRTDVLVFAGLGSLIVLLVAGTWALLGPRPPTPVAATGCASCHEAPVPEHFGASCVACHLGDPSADTVPQAHAELEAEPGALETAGRTCGACHPTEHRRVVGSLMATGRGLVAVDRWAFGEIGAPSGHQTLTEVLETPSPTPAEDHLRRLCAGCHLHTRRDNRDDAVQGTGSGCGACHVLTDTSGHPDVEPVPPDATCLGCHSRSSRISLAYAGLAEIAGPAACANPTTLYDGREGCRLEADAHHEAGLACVDCHLHTELMGSGELALHKADALEVHCETCHDREAPTTTWGRVDDPITRAILRLRGQSRPDGEPVRLGAKGTPVWNLRPGPEAWWLQPKGGGAPHRVPPTPRDVDHERAGHERLTCDTCHAAWVPRCTSCHTEFDSEGSQWDFGTGRVEPGAWREHALAMEVGEPVLAVTAEDQVVPAVPGMIMTLELPSGVRREARLHAPTSPHTTRRRARSCVDCHRSGGMLGLGTGPLTIASGGWRFEPENLGYDGLVRDAWVAPGRAEPGEGTREGFRSLSRAERRRVLRVGYCLGCHPGSDPRYADFETARIAFGLGQCEDQSPYWID